MYAGATIRSRAPARISFAGGATDVIPYVDEFGGKVISGSISKYAYGTFLRRRDTKICIESGDFLKSIEFKGSHEMEYNKELDLFKAVIRKMAPDMNGFDIYLRNEVPPGTGLGSSASAFVALIGLFNHLKGKKRMTDYEIAEMAINLERNELKVPGGKQDQYASVFGGLNYIEFEGGYTRVQPLRMSEEHLMELEKHLVLFYTKPRKVAGGDIIADQIKNYNHDKVRMRSIFEEMKGIVDEVRYALLGGDFERFGTLLDESWKSKKKISRLISGPEIERYYEIAKKHGAIGGKISGAGGGGAMFFYCRPNTEQIVAEKLSQAGATHVPFSFDSKGLRVWEV